MIKHLFNIRIFVVALLCLSFFTLHFVLESCVPRTSNHVQVKVFALAPEKFLDQETVLSGKLLSYGPGQAFFKFQDATGEISVTTENIQEKMTCAQGANIKISGRFQKRENDAKRFSLTRVLDCSL